METGKEQNLRYAGGAIKQADFWAMPGSEAYMGDLITLDSAGNIAG